MARIEKYLCGLLPACVLFLFARLVFAQYIYIYSWFSEETNCDGQNIVHICYNMYVPYGDSAYVSIRMSPDSGATWDVPLITLIGAEGDIGPNIPSGLHCFDWLMSEDYFGQEGYNWLLEVFATLILFHDSFTYLDTALYDINGNDGYVAADSEYFVLTRNSVWRNGRLITIDSFFIDTLVVEFDFKFNPGYCDLPSESTGADGMSLIFTPYLDPPIAWGGSLGIINSDGWGFEFDTYNNFCGSPQSDINGNHTAVSIDSTACLFVGIDPIPLSLVQVALPFELTNRRWHNAMAVIEHPRRRLFIDGTLYIDNSFPSLTPFWAHIGFSAATGLCYSEHIIDNLSIREHIRDTISGVHVSRAPLDSRPPDVDIRCPFITSIGAGDTIRLTWSIHDLFWDGDPCSLTIDYCAGRTTVMVSDTIYNWIVPASAVGCDTIWFRVAARDSFCNWGYDSCFISAICTPALVTLLCGPCNNFTSCPDQLARFLIVDPNHFAIDTMRVFFTVVIRHVGSFPVIIRLREPTANLTFNCPGGRCDSLIVNVLGFEFRDTDTISITLDSLYNINNCRTIP